MQILKFDFHFSQTIKSLPISKETIKNNIISSFVSYRIFTKFNLQFIFLLESRKIMQSGSVKWVRK
ncbi:hypothetical protein V6Z11_A05G377800 [Gossypium hirsutum]